MKGEAGCRCLAESWDVSYVTRLESLSLALASTISGVITFGVGFPLLVTDGHDHPCANNVSSRFTEGKAGVCLSIPGKSPELTLTELAAVPLFTFYQLQDFTQVLRLREEPHSDVENESWGGGWMPK